MSLQLGDDAEFAAKRHCLIEQYGGFREPQTSERLNGESTASGNIADNTGITLAYRAYRKRSEKFTSEWQDLIGLEFSWDRLFWLSFAQTWCGVYRKGMRLFNARQSFDPNACVQFAFAEETMRRLTSDNHAIERFRVIGTLQNSAAFAKDFNCSQLSPMNRKNKCIIW
jgi:putative endopeptidase